MAATLLALGGSAALSGTAVGTMATAAAAYVPAATTVATAASIGSAALGGVGAVAAGHAAAQDAKFTAGQLEQQAEEDIAVAQRRAGKARRERELVLSSVLAKSAAEGDASGASVTNIMEGIEQQGEYNELAEMYSGYSSSAKKYAAASSSRARGRAKTTAGYLGAVGSTMKGLYGAAKPYI